MTFPLACNQSREVVLANALYYSKACVSGPAMTWPINTIAFLRAGDGASAGKKSGGGGGGGNSDGGGTDGDWHFYPVLFLNTV